MARTVVAETAAAIVAIPAAASSTAAAVLAAPAPAREQRKREQRHDEPPLPHHRQTPSVFPSVTTNLDFSPRDRFAALVARRSSPITPPGARYMNRISTPP